METLTQEAPRRSAADLIRGIMGRTSASVPEQQAISRPPIDSLTAVPELIQDWADGNSLCLVWKNMREQKLAVGSARGIHPLDVLESIPEDIRRACNFSKQFLTDEGWLKRGDLVLCTQSLEARDLHREDIRTRNMRMNAGIDRESISDPDHGYRAVTREEWVDSPSDLFGGHGGGYTPI